VLDMPNLDALKTGDIKDLMYHLSYYFSDIAYAMMRDNRDFETMEYINFAMLDILTSMYHSIPNDLIKHRARFVSNIKEIIDGLEANKGECNGRKEG
jgi:hypothetical protein